MSGWFRFTVFAVLGLCIAVVDFRTQKIPNVLLLAMLSALLAADLLGDFKMIPYRLLAGLGAYWLFYMVYRLRGGLGYGDVKYAGVIGYYLGPGLVINGLLYAVLLGLTYWCVGYLIFRWSKEQRFPFGPWLSCGAVAAGLLYQSMP